MYEEQYLKVTHPAKLADVKAALATLPEPEEEWAEARKPSQSFGFPVTVVVYGPNAAALAEVVARHLSEALAPARALKEDDAVAERDRRMAMYEEQYLKVTDGVPLGDVFAALRVLPEPDEEWAEAMGPLQPGYSATVVVYGPNAKGFAKVVQAHLNQVLAPARTLTEDEAVAERNASDGGR